MALSTDWINHIEAWQRSELSQAEYCRQQRLGYSSFTVRLSAYRKTQKESAPLPRSATALIPVQIQPSVAESIRLTTRHGHQVELPTSISAVWLAELLRCLA